MSTTYYPRRGPAVLAVVAGLALVVSGVWAWFRWSSNLGTIGVLCGLTAVVAGLAWLLPSRSFLHLGDRGFSYSTAFRARRVDWRSVARFGIAQDGPRRCVAWDYVANYPADATSRAANKARVGFEAILPACCSASPETLLAALEAARQRSTDISTTAGTTPSINPGR